MDRMIRNEDEEEKKGSEKSLESFVEELNQDGIV